MRLWVWISNGFLIHWVDPICNIITLTEYIFHSTKSLAFNWNHNKFMTLLRLYVLPPRKESSHQNTKTNNGRCHDMMDNITKWLHMHYYTSDSVSDHNSLAALTKKKQKMSISNIQYEFNGENVASCYKCIHYQIWNGILF